MTATNKEKAKKINNKSTKVVYVPGKNNQSSKKSTLKYKEKKQKQREEMEEIRKMFDAMRAEVIEEMKECVNKYGSEDLKKVYNDNSSTKEQKKEALAKELYGDNYEWCESDSLDELEKEYYDEKIMGEYSIFDVEYEAKNDDNKVDTKKYEEAVYIKTGGNYTRGNSTTLDNLQQEHQQLNGEYERQVGADKALNKLVQVVEQVIEL